MEKQGWKNIAIVFIILFSLLVLFYVWVYWSVGIEDDKINECFYDICSESIDAEYLANVCSCYDYDVLGNVIVAKTEYMG